MLAGPRAPRGSWPLGGLQPVRRAWGGLAGSLARCTGRRLRRGWRNPSRGTRSAEIEGAGFTLIRPCPLDQWSTAFTIAISRGGSQGGGEAEAHTVSARASDARARDSHRVVCTYTIKADVEVASVAFAHPASGSRPDSRSTRPIAERLEAAAAAADGGGHKEVTTSASEPGRLGCPRSGGFGQGWFERARLVAMPGRVHRTDSVSHR